MNPQVESQSPIELDPNIDDNEIAEVIQSVYEATYFDASSMAPLSPASVAALNRLRAFKSPPFSAWNRLPLSRRSAVLILLFADRHGDLRVVITMRATTLRTYSGQAALPGGKADTLEETPFQIARREASEEIGLTSDDRKIPPPFRIEHLCELPYNLAKTALAVRPCVAFLHSDDTSGSKSVTVEGNLIPRLDAKEVAAVFSAPFHNFLRVEDEIRDGEVLPGRRTDWYSGRWIEWHDGRWRMHNFFVPITNQQVARPRVGERTEEAAVAEPPEVMKKEVLSRYQVWGVTARMLVDAARVAYGEDPEFEFNSHLGDETLIEMLQETGRLREKVPGGPDLTEPDSSSAKATDAKI